MQVLVLRLDYRSSTAIEALQKQIRPPVSKRPAQLPHIPLSAYQQAAPHQLKAAVEPILERTAALPFSAGDIGFSKDASRFYLQVHPNQSLSEFHGMLQLAVRQFSTIGTNSSWSPRIPLIDHIQAPFWGPLFARLALEDTALEGTASALECWSIINGKTTIEWTIFLDN